MSAPLVFRAIAQAEFEEAAVRYENQREGLGVDFVIEVERILRVIEREPLRYSIVLEDVREAIVHRFPFAIYYRLKASRTVIIAVFHCSRDPNIWQGRV